MSEDVCRMCLQRGSSSNFISMNFGYPSIRAKLSTLLPELNLDLSHDPVVCAPCSASLENAYHLKLKCLRSEERIWSHLHHASLNIRPLPTPIKLANLIPIPPAIDPVINHEEIMVEPSFNYYHQNYQLRNPIEKTIQSLDSTGSSIKSVSSSASTCSTASSLTNVIQCSNNENVYICPTCKQSYLTKDELHKHIPNHLATRPHMCSFCYKCFSLKSNLQIHARTHTQDRPYNCEHCPKTFTTKGNLKTHIRVHTKEKPYVCHICDKSFIQKVQLNTHMLLHENQQIFACDVCDKSFCSKGTLIVHKRIHEDVKPFSCEYCHKTFTTNGNLLIHVRKHTGEKPYSCSECDKAFSQVGQLKIHMRCHVPVSQTTSESNEVIVDNESPKKSELPNKSFQWSTLNTDLANQNNTKIS